MAWARLSIRHAFTLIELLVAVAVLSVLILLFAQMLGFRSNALTQGTGRVNNFTKARAMLDLMARDFQAGIFRSDLAAFPAAATTEFYAQRPGVSSGTVRYASLVKYSLPSGTNTLERSDGPILWTDPATYLAFGNTTGFTPSAGSSPTLTPRDTAPGVIAFQIVFMQADGTLSSTTFTPARSASGVLNSNSTRIVGITLAVVNDQTLKKLSTNQVATLSDALKSRVTAAPSHNIKATWDDYLNSTLSWNSYPKDLGSGLIIFERYVILPSVL